MMNHGVRLAGISGNSSDHGATARGAKTIGRAGGRAVAVCLLPGKRKGRGVAAALGGLDPWYSTVASVRTAALVRATDLRRIGFLGHRLEPIAQRVHADVISTTAKPRPVRNHAHRTKNYDRRSVSDCWDTAQTNKGQARPKTSNPSTPGIDTAQRTGGEYWRAAKLSVRRAVYGRPTRSLQRPPLSRPPT